VDVGPTFVAYGQPAVTSQPGQRAFYHPPVPSQPLAGVDPAPGEMRAFMLLLLKAFRQRGKS